MHDNAELLFRRHALSFFGGTSRVLEIGPDWSPSTLQRAAEGRYAAWETVDLPRGPSVGPLTHYMDQEDRFPIGDAEFDVVVSSSVIEHVRRPWRWYPELARMCRPGGYVVTIAPVSWPEHKNDDVPYDCWRILPDGMSVLIADAGLELVTEVCATLEPPGQSGRWYPGETYRFGQPGRRPRVQRVVNMLDRLARRPRSAAVDCLTIARKP